ncbi:hypothetical protein E1301_Tti004289 [Triplophysa tibetana]|uniref:SEA domain-containing protein n=1 Tax=Triplophysa tibetana TaxID=1572043 RepID=A0A5A9NAZ3_9TELE|nr:hypothetical protein E1301_Tti004289 [Triplophysa tibetana]
MLLMHRLLIGLFIFISTPALTNVVTSADTSMSTSPTSIDTAAVASTTNSTTTHPHTSTVGITAITTINTNPANTNNSTTSTTPIRSTGALTNVVTSADTSMSTSPTSIDAAAVASTTNSTTTHPHTSTVGITAITTINTNPANTNNSTTSTTPIRSTGGHATTTPAFATTAASTISPPVSTAGNDTNHPTTATNPPVTTSGTASMPSSTAGENVTSPLFSTSGNTTVVVNTATLITPVNVTSSSGNPATTPITTLSNATSPSFTTHVSHLTTPGITTVPLVTTPGNTTSAQTIPVNATTPPQPTQVTCPAVPCPALSVCVDSTCQCLAGTLFENGACVVTKTFPSMLRVNRTFNANMNKTDSIEFKEFAKEIISAVNTVMRHQSSYINSVVIKLMEGSVIATVNSFFEANSPVTQKTFDQTIDDAIKNCGSNSCGILGNATYTATSLCAQIPAPCDDTSTVCGMTNGFVNCACRPGYVPNLYQSMSCETSLLALVVVACVLGGILLIGILAVLIYICVTNRREKSQDRFYSTPYPIENIQNIQSTWSSQGIAPIPRATLASSSSNNAGDISLEMTDGAGRKRNSNGLTGSYDLTTDGMRTFKGKNPSRYSYLVGQENPYYLDGEERRTT